MMPDWETITLPAWATTDEAKAWAAGLIFGCIFRIFRAGLRWFKGAGVQKYD
jgi:hypothetical protein